MNEKDFNKLLSVYLDDKITTDEVILLKDAVEEVPAYRHQFQEEIRLHTLLREASIETLEEKKQNRRNRQSVSHHRSPRKPILVYVLSIAAAVAVIGTILGIYFIQNQPGTPIGICEQTPDEGIHQVIRSGKTLSLHTGMQLYDGDRVISKDASGSFISLNDGSMISLEKDTELTLSENGDSQVKLIDGEIVLEVNKRAASENPFTVMTNDSVMTVMGTIFRVNADKNGFTKLSVYDGSVELTRSSDQSSVKVNANQSVISSDKNLAVKPIEENSTGESIILKPTDDVYTEGKKMVNSKQLRVRKGERTIYLRFSLKDIGPIKKAVLELKQDIDPGSGTLFFHLGEHANWNEKTITFSSAPKVKELISKRTGAVTSGKIIEIDLSSHIKNDGDYTIIITLNKGDAHDIWFSSKEGVKSPVLKLLK